MKNFILTTVIFCSAFFCCNVNGNKTVEPLNDSVKLVFIDPPEQGSFGKISFVGPSFLAYIGQDKLPVHIKLNEISDTLTLPVDEGYLEISHQYKAWQFFYFYLKGGDVVTFRYNDMNQPIAESSLSGHQTEQYNFMQKIDNRSLESGFSPRTLMNPQFFKSEEHRRKQYDDYSRYMDSFRIMLDDAAENRSLDSIYMDYYTKLYLLEKELFLHYGKNLSSQQYTPDINRIEWDDDRIKYISYVNNLQYKNIDTILENRSIPFLTKNAIIYKYLRVYNLPSQVQTSTEELDKIYERIIADTGDSTVVRRILTEFAYRYKAPADMTTGDMMLRNMEGVDTTLDSVLTKHHGKIIYIDFFASWCGPCKSQFPAADILKKAYARKEVVFLYLALFDDEEGWKIVVDEYGLNSTASESYFIANGDKSDWVRKLNITRVPRYILIDKAGEIVDTNAPCPLDEKGIRKALNELLLQ